MDNLIRMTILDLKLERTLLLIRDQEISNKIDDLIFNYEYYIHNKINPEFEYTSRQIEKLEDSLAILHKRINIIDNKIDSINF